MKKYLILLLLLLFNRTLYAQFYENNTWEYAIVNNVNIREGASLSTKVIATLKQGEKIMICRKRNINDKIDGRDGAWIPVIHDGKQGYIWSHMLASSSFTHKSGNRLLLKTELKGTSYKVFSNDSLINTGKLDETYSMWYSCFYEVRPLFAVKPNIYFKMYDSELLYSFDGFAVKSAGKCDSSNISAIHQSSQKKVPGIYPSFINSGQVNLRDAPSLKAKIIDKLAKNTRVSVIEKQSMRVVVNNDEDYWYKIRVNGKVGYVWGKSLSIPLMHIYDNDDPNTTYLLCHNALFVLINGKIMAGCTGLSEMYDETIHSFGDLGFGKGYDFIAIESMAHSCGEYGGDHYYRWNGKTLKHFYKDGGVGDGAFYEGVDLIFPSDNEGMEGKLLVHYYSGEGLSMMPIDSCESSSFNAVQYDYSSILAYDGDTLVEAPSKHLQIKQLVQQQFPKYEITQYQFGDINGDGLEDVFFQVTRQIITKDERGDDVYHHKTKLGFAFRKSNDSLEVIEMNESLISKEEDYRIQITLKESKTSITVISNSSMENENEDKLPNRKVYDFTYNVADQKVYWESITLIDADGPKKFSFKTKKVSFKDAWSYEPEPPGEAEQ